MKIARPSVSVFLSIVSIFIFCLASAQDKIYTNQGELINARVTLVSPTVIKYVATDNPNGPVYIVYPNRIDSIAYANGKVDYLYRGRPAQRKILRENIPQLNTWSYDIMGFAFMSLSQSYERRLKNGIIGFRVPLYVGFVGGSIAGVGLFTPLRGIYYPFSYFYNNNGNAKGTNSGKSGSSISTGLNVKCYLFRRRTVRAFVGPEVTAGYSTFRNGPYVVNGVDYNQNGTLTTYGTIAAQVKMGLSFNPIDKFNITIDGGGGIGDVFGHEPSNSSPVGLTGLWHLGIAFGTNF